MNRLPSTFPTSPDQVQVITPGVVTPLSQVLADWE